MKSEKFTSVIKNSHLSSPRQVVVESEFAQLHIGLQGIIVGTEDLEAEVPHVVGIALIQEVFHLLKVTLRQGEG